MENLLDQPVPAQRLIKEGKSIIYQQVAKGISSQTESISLTASSVDQMGRAIENITSISEENSAAIGEVSASSEEMSAQVQEVTAEAMTLAQMANALQQVVAQFRLAQA
jgi:hypothetical protein